MATHWLELVAYGAKPQYAHDLTSARHAAEPTTHG